MGHRLGELSVRSTLGGALSETGGNNGGRRARGQLPDRDRRISDPAGRALAWLVRRARKRIGRLDRGNGRRAVVRDDDAVGAAGAERISRVVQSLAVAAAGWLGGARW